MPYAIFHKVGLGKPQPIIMRLLMVNRNIKKPIGKLHDVLVQVNMFIFLSDFVIVGCALGYEIPIILKMPILSAEGALVQVEYGKIKFRLNDEEVSFNFFQSMK